MSLKKTSMATNTVLVVDDEGQVRKLIRHILEYEGIAAYEAASGEEAVRLYLAHRDQIDLILLDVQMAGMDGPQTLDTLRQINPSVRCCFLTGDTGRYTEDELLRHGALRILYKPFVLTAVQELLSGQSSSPIQGAGTDTVPTGETRPVDARAKDQSDQETKGS